MEELGKRSRDTLCKCGHIWDNHWISFGPTGCAGENPMVTYDQRTCTCIGFESLQDSLDSSFDWDKYYVESCI